MADDTIKSFLVGLGFKVDQSSMQKFEASVATVTAGVEALAVAAAAAAVAVTAAVTKMAAGFDELYWTSKNLGSSAGEIKALGYAFGQLGGSAGDANNALKSIANFTMAYGPGAAGFLARLGVAPKDIGDAAATFRDLEGIFQRMVSQNPQTGLARANAIAGALGLSSDQLRVMLRDNGQYEHQLRAFADRMGINFDEATKSSNKFMTEIRTLRAEFELWLDSKGIVILEALVPKLEAMAHWVEDMASGKKMSVISEEIRDIVRDIGSLLKALEDLAHSDAGKGFAERLLWAFDNVLRATAQMVKVFDDVVNHRWKQAWIDATSDPTKPWSAVVKDANSGSGGGGGGGGGGGWGSGTPAGSASGGATGGGTSSRSPIIAAGEYFRERMRGAGFNSEQIRGVAAGIKAEGGGLGMAANGAFGIGQWRGARARELFRRYGSNPSLSQQIEFLIWELQGGDHGGASVRGQSSAISTMTAYLRDFMRPQGAHNEHLADLRADISRGMAALGNPTPLGTLSGKSLTFNQTNNFNNHGADPQALGSEIGKQQEYANQKMMTSASVYQW